MQCIVAKRIAMGILISAVVALGLWVRLSPRRYADLLATIALYSKSKQIIGYALEALNEHRRITLEADSSGSSQPAYSRFACGNKSSTPSPFCDSEKQVVSLLTEPNAPYSLPKLKELLDRREYGKRFSEDKLNADPNGALGHTMKMLYDRRGAGADLNNEENLLIGRDDGMKRTRMIPCELIDKIHEYWSKVIPEKCVGFIKNNNQGKGGYNVSGCFQFTFSSADKSTGWWWYDLGKDEQGWTLERVVIGTDGLPSFWDRIGECKGEVQER
jgi:hypothetical protein